MDMKRSVLILLIIVCWPLSAMAATLSCDAQPGVERYEFQGLGTITESPAQPGGIMSVNLDALPAGNYTIKAKACQGVWCSNWSEEYPFVKPALSPPGGKRIER
jgi:hypothetical protein